MDKVHEFRNRARECRELALNSAADAIREQYFQLAHIWERLAEERLQFFAAGE
ncbi:MAG TPA: hypothetical protein VN718_08755 [Rhizomicrobium sp.]|nr:hypothetical protein [Rhizomicrobium sp.]